MLLRSAIISSSFNPVSTLTSFRTAVTSASKLKVGSVIRESDGIWSVESLREVVVQDQSLFAVNLTNVSTHTSRPTTIKATSEVDLLRIVRRPCTVTSIHKFAPMFEGGKHRAKLWLWLDKPAFDGRSDFMLDASRAGVFPQVDELFVGSRIISHWCEDEPLFLTIPENHRPSSAQFEKQSN